MPKIVKLELISIITLYFTTKKNQCVNQYCSRSISLSEPRPLPDSPRSTSSPTRKSCDYPAFSRTCFAPPSPPTAETPALVCSRLDVGNQWDFVCSKEVGWSSSWAKGRALVLGGGCWSVGMRRLRETYLLAIPQSAQIPKYPKTPLKWPKTPTNEVLFIK